MSLNPQPLVIIEYNCYVASNDVELGHFLTGLAKDQRPHWFDLSEARTHYGTIKDFCANNGYFQFQLPPAPNVPSGRKDKDGKEIMLVNEQGDEAILVRNDMLPYLAKKKVVKMRREWEVTGHNEWHTGREYLLAIFKFPKSSPFTGDRKVKVRNRCSHWPTHGFKGANKIAFNESAIRSRVWLAVALKAVSLDVGDLNQNVKQIAAWFGKSCQVVGFGIDMIVAKNARKIEHTVLGKGPSDHHAQLFKVWI